jgi:hypothetical protein
MFGIVIVFAIVCGFIAAAIAKSRGAYTATAFVLGLLIGPFGILIACFLPAICAQVPEGSAGSALAPAGFLRECPYCRSTIRADAAVCRYCQRESAATPLPVFSDECYDGRRHKVVASETYPGYYGCTRCTEYGLAP